MVLGLAVVGSACGSIVVPGNGADADAGGQADGDVSVSPDTATPQCTFGQDQMCDDQDPCTTDACNTKGECVNTPSTDVCKIEGQCYPAGAVSSANACKVCDLAKSKSAWSDVSCAADGNPCTDDACDAADGCAYPPVVGGSCDDGVACTTDDRCEGGACVATPCACTTDALCEAELTPGPCQKAACVDNACQLVADAALDGSACSDGDDCTAGDACDGGLCVGDEVDCTGLDGPCSTGECVEGNCKLTLLAEGAPCQAANACILDATCGASGNCEGTWDGSKCKCGSSAECDDGRACTLDTCDKATGACLSTPVAGTCLLGGECWQNGDIHPFDQCLECDVAMSATEWTAVSCDDGDACTVDSCDAVEGCSQAAGPAGSCCKFASDCLAAGLVAGACQVVSCKSGACEVVADETASGKACDDESACTIDDVCEAGACKGGVPKSCEQPGPGSCATVACEAGSGECVETLLAVGAGCDDANACTVSDACDAAGACAGTAKDCGAGDVCTLATCEQATGECKLVAKEGGACDDGEACTTGDACTAEGSCEGGWDGSLSGCACTSDADCDDGLACTVDACNVSAGACSNTVAAGACLLDGVCVADKATKPGNACLECQAAVSKKAWQPVACNDGNACTTDFCDAGSGCKTEPKTGAPCDDGNPDTTDDHCEAGACVASCACTVAADCAGVVAPACSKVVCEACACLVVADAAAAGKSCEDGLYCTVNDTCTAGTCVAGAPRDCSSKGDAVCLEGTCSEPNDACVATPKSSGSSCTDGNPCTVGDACAAGACKGAEIDCSDLETDCESASCSGGVCTTTVLTGAGCDDGEACTLSDTCTVDGACTGSWDKVNCGCTDDSDCAGGTDQCNIGRCDLANNECTTEPQTAQTCTDGNACTKTDACTAQGTCKGAAYTCAALSCELASCDGAGGCSVSLLSGFCRIDGACVADKEVNPANPCQVCNAAQAPTAWSARPNGTLCDADGSGCTQNDACADGVCKAGAAAACTDGLACTTDTCTPLGANGYTCQYQANGTGCFIGGGCWALGAVNPGNACQECAAADKTGWSNKSNSTPCNADSSGCTSGDSCQTGLCVAGTVETCDDGLGCTTDKCVSTGVSSFSCDSTVGTGSCLIAGTCYGVGATNPANQCQECASGNKTGWSSKSNGVSCNADSNGCTQNDVCQAGACKAGATVTCSDGDTCTVDTCTSTGNNSQTCTNVVSSGSCLIGGNCVAQGVANPANPCQVCNPALNLNDWSAAANGTACNADSNGCTKADSCSGGSCKAGAPESCSDGLTCTADTCSSTGPETFSCNSAITAGCLIGGTCYAQAASNPGNPCQVCNTAVSNKAWANANDGTACNADSDGCTENDKCALGACQAGSTQKCNDGVSCTTDKCISTGPSGYNCSNAIDPGVCAINGVCYSSGKENPASQCQTCDPGNDPKGWSNLKPGEPCNADGSGCTVGDACDGAGACAVGSTQKCADGLKCTNDVCQSTSPTTFVCSNPLSAVDCLIGGVCYADGAVDPTNGCKGCDTKTSNTAWSTRPDGASCDLGTACTSKDFCKSGTCGPGIIDGCYISQFCYAAEETNPKDECLWCNPAKTQTKWSVVTFCGGCVGGASCKTAADCGGDGTCKFFKCQCF
jgi:hypothetical protein